VLVAKKPMLCGATIGVKFRYAEDDIVYCDFFESPLLEQFNVLWWSNSYGAVCADIFYHLAGFCFLP
jgi:hypothetical protein